MLKSSIDNLYQDHDCQRICQGDILRDFIFPILNNEEVQAITFPYIIVISQDCDLERVTEQAQRPNSEATVDLKQFLPNLMFTPAFVDEEVRKGTHLQELFNITQEKYNSDRWKIIKQNNNERYHYLNADADKQVPSLVIDFKHYYTLSYDNFVSQYTDCYLTTINELFRERLSQRFSGFLSRIGLPDLSNKA